MIPAPVQPVQPVQQVNQPPNNNQQIHQQIKILGGPHLLHTLSPHYVTDPFSPYILDRSIFGYNYSYQNVNRDTNLQKQVFKYYKKKIIGWIRFSFRYRALLSFITVNNKGYPFLQVDKKEDLKNNEIKENFLMDKIIDDYDLLKTLFKFCKKYRLNLYNLCKSSIDSSVKKFIYKRTLKNLRYQLGRSI